MTNTDAPEAGHGSYFFLSYAYSPPLAGSRQAEPDQWVRRFFEDLDASVRSRARPRTGSPGGFFDQAIPVGADRSGSLTEALSATQVFVPLLSPGYFAKSWPGREWACFHRRLTDAGFPDPLRRFAPVLWIPLPEDRQRPPGLPEALALGTGEPAYAAEGLRALLRIRPYREAYRSVVDRLAGRIVDLAERAPIPPSAVPDIKAIQSPFRDETAAAVFAVTVAAPTADLAPDGCDPRRYGSDGEDWRPFPDLQELRLTDYAAEAAERLDFAAGVVDIEKAGDQRGSGPGVLLIDPWFAATASGERVLRAFIRNLPPWVLPTVIMDPSADPRATELAGRVAAILNAAGALHTETARRAARGVGSLQGFVALMPLLVTEAERQYLRHRPIRRPTVPPGTRPRLGGGTPAVSRGAEEEPGV